jgi:hypothetical protein
MTKQPPTLPLQLHWGLVACAAISIAIHFFLLVGLPKSRPPADFRPADYRTLEARKVQVRLTEGKAAPTAAKAAPVSPAPTAQKAKAQAPAPNKGTSKAAAPTTNASAETAGRAEAAVPVPVATPLTEPSEASEFDDYLPRDLLSQPPEALTEIVIAAPPEEDFPGRRVGILTLFIDEEGQVRHVAPDDLLLPQALEQLAREAFMAGRFSPGQVNGRATKSRMRVEVVFE